MNWTTAEGLAELTRLAEKATPGPWSADPCNAVPNCYLIGPAPAHDLEPVPPGLYKCRMPVVMRPEDGLFIAAARDAIPQLLVRIVELEARVQAYEW